ncbi:CAP domain-containing protein [Skermanella mucosa]|uniref:CAP domain-containing protein n=1 Tax=Skermanella mucosa TaxID=1789672 RepID=UPI00192C23AB|nr:CAP domain-containing protein [Skermanella mucosa]UEM23290.1 CAP domain-containing protein [Skermanella mucosa]
MTEPTALDQYLIELINRARLDPTAEAARLGIDINQGLSDGQISTAPKQPLAFDPDLTEAARGHAGWMLDSDVFSHTGAEGSNPGTRMADAGYEFTGNWRWGENISWRGTIGPAEDAAASVGRQHDALFLSPGHRENILQDDFREIGAATVSGDFQGYDTLMVAESFGKTGDDVFLTGVAYDDLDGNDFYTPGEGRGGINVTATPMGSAEPVSLTDLTGTAGGYEIAAQPGTYSVTFSGGGLAAPVVQTVELGSENVKLDLIDPEVAPPAPGSEVAGVSGIGSLASLIDYFAAETEGLDFAALVDHVQTGEPLPDAWVDTIQDGVEVLRTVDVDAIADELSGFIGLAGLPDVRNADDGQWI